MKKTIIAAMLMYSFALGAIAAEGPTAIPHSIETYEITKEANACLMCHKKTDSLGDAGDISATHFVDREGKELDTVASSYNTCTMCHMPAAPEPAK